MKDRVSCGAFVAALGESAERRHHSGGLSRMPAHRGAFRAPAHDAAHLGRAADTYDETVGRYAAAALYVLTLVAVVVGVDVLFFRHHFLERLIANVGIVLVFAAFGLKFRHALAHK
jgi:hypothetical protein